MMKKSSLVSRLKWYFAGIALLAILLAYANLSGWRIMSTTEQKHWNANSAGSFHK